MRGDSKTVPPAKRGELPSDRRGLETPSPELGEVGANGGPVVGDAPLRAGIGEKALQVGAVCRDRVGGQSALEHQVVDVALDWVSLPPRLGLALHRSSAAPWRKGFERRSRPIVVGSRWPG